MAAQVLPDIVSQHAEEAAFLWILRDHAVGAPHYSLKDLAKLDGRIEAHLDGLRIAGDEGRAALEADLAREEPGEAFAAAVLALETGERDRFDRVLAAARAAPEMRRGLVSACGWVAWEALEGRIAELAGGGSAFLQAIGIGACALHRADPGPALDAALADPDPWLRARAARAAGELGRRDLISRLLAELAGEVEACRFWAAWSAVRLGERAAALELLKSLPLSGSPYGERAAFLAVRAMAPEAAQSWLKTLAQNPKWLRLTIRAIGARGDPSYLPWLIECMSEPAMARPAGESVSMITGLDLAYEDLDGDAPEGFEAGPSEAPEEEDVALDSDEDLPWPAAGAIQRWWDANRGRFEAGGRYLLGRPVAEAQCRQVLREGFQRQRRAAALELALTDPERALYETRAPGPRQLRELEAVSAG